MYYVCDTIPDYVTIELIDDLNRKLIDTKDHIVIYQTLWTGEGWRKNLWLTHKVDGPAVIVYDSNFEKVLREQYYYFGRMHRIGAPAYISYLFSGEVIYESYCIAGESCNDELQYLVALENFKNKELENEL